ncbi:hypothetical protein ACVPOR_10840 [Staphylococcus aureus]
MVKTNDAFELHCYWIWTSSDNMVRVLVAFLIEVGKGRHEISDVPKLLESRIVRMFLSLHRLKDYI